jgi:hypothetical protein
VHGDGWSLCRSQATFKRGFGNTKEKIRTQAMKKLLLGALLIASVATPALAQSFNPEFGTANVSNTPLAERSNGNGATYGAYAYQPAGSESYASIPHARRWNSPHREQFQDAPFQDENY